MKIYLRILICLFGNIASAENYIPLDTSKSHLNFNLEKGPFQIKAFPEKNLGGVPVIELNESGLLIDGKQVCQWPDKKFAPERSYNMVLIDMMTKGACWKTKVIRSTWGDGGTGTAVLTIEVVKLEKDMAIIENQHKRLVLPLQSLKGKYKLTKPGELTNQVGD